jgi:hypothetical protein
MLAGCDLDLLISAGHIVSPSRTRTGKFELYDSYPAFMPGEALRLARLISYPTTPKLPSCPPAPSMTMSMVMKLTPWQNGFPKATELSSE